MADDDVLSSDELEALSQGAAPASGGSETEGRPVDLASLERRVPLPLPGLDAVLEQFATDLARRLGMLLGAPVEARPQGLRALSCEDYANGLAIPSHITPLALDGQLQGHAVLVLSAGLVDQLVSRRFGGGSSSRRGEAQNRSLSPAESRLGEQVARDLAAGLAESLRPLAAVEVRPGDVVGNQRLVGSFAGSREPLVTSAFELSCDDQTSRVELAIPYSLLRPLEATLRAGLPDRPEEDAPKQYDLNTHGASDVELELAVCLTGQGLTLAEVSALQVGDVLRIDPPEQARLVADGVTLAEGAFGVVGDFNAIRIDRTHLGKRQRQRR